jgi:hypothetical protein
MRWLILLLILILPLASAICDCSSTQWCSKGECVESYEIVGLVTESDARITPGSTLIDSKYFLVNVYDDEEFVLAASGVGGVVRDVYTTPFELPTHIQWDGDIQNVQEAVLVYQLGRLVLTPLMVLPQAYPLSYLVDELVTSLN